MDISKDMGLVDELMQRQVAEKAAIIEPICARFRAMDLSTSPIILDLTYEETSELKGGSLPALAYALSKSLPPTETALTVVVRGPGMPDWPIEFSPLD